MTAWKSLLEFFISAYSCVVWLSGVFMYISEALTFTRKETEINVEWVKEKGCLLMIWKKVKIIHLQTHWRTCFYEMAKFQWKSTIVWKGQHPLWHGCWRRQEYRPEKKGDSRIWTGWRIHSPHAARLLTSPRFQLFGLCLYSFRAEHTKNITKNLALMFNQSCAYFELWTFGNF